MDFLASKGIEYLLVLGYLAVLIPFWWVLMGARKREAAPAPARQAAAAPRPRGWFRVPQGLHYHLGHTWAAPEGGGVFRVGVDDFAQKLVGPPDAVRLPPPGTTLEQGERAWSLEAGGRRVALLSPVAGRVVAVNPALAGDPSLVSEEPYGRGWLMKVRVPRPEITLKNLLPWRVATAWMDDAAQALSARMSPELGTVLQDGGVPVAGIAREIDRERWDRVAAELLLTG
jgi:glycine cleavage system H lipoate-binding protein